jgi:hydrogenase expression/formation protein HypD
MKYIDEYRDPGKVKTLLKEIASTITQPVVVMEICGGQTHAFMHHGLDAMLPTKLELVHGPGCPVCVTPLEQIDRALAIASVPGVIFTSYGDMLRVPGSTRNLFSVRASGADVRVVYSPLEAVEMAEKNTNKQVVFFAIGFETTAPPNAMAILQAWQRGIKNFSVVVSHVCVPPAMNAILSSKTNRVQAFLAAGHVCAVMGYHEYPIIARKYKVPIAVTGFEPVDLLRGLLAVIRQMEAGVAEVENMYECKESSNLWTVNGAGLVCFH